MINAQQAREMSNMHLDNVKPLTIRDLDFIIGARALKGKLDATIKAPHRSKNMPVLANVCIQRGFAVEEVDDPKYYAIKISWKEL